MVTAPFKLKVRKVFGSTGVSCQPHLFEIGDGDFEVGHTSEKAAGRG